MKFRMFTEFELKLKIAVNVDQVRQIIENKNGGTVIEFRDYRPPEIMEVGEYDFGVVRVAEDFDTVFSRLNTIAE